MTHRTSACLLCLMALALLCNCTRAPRFGEKVVICGDDKLQIIQTSTSDSTHSDIIWEWKAKDGESYWEADFTRRLRSLDDCKPIDGGKKLLVTSSSGGVLIIDIETKAVLFHAVVPMAHSAELLPGGRIAVALSTHGLGNSLELYDINRGGNERLYRDTLYSGHGTVWMPEQKLLYTLGYNEIRAYRLKDWETATPSLEETKRWDNLPQDCHDLVRLSSHELIVTCNTGVHVFDTDNGSYRDFEPLKGMTHVKSVNYEPKTGQLIYTKGEISWWTHHVYSRHPDWQLNIDSIDVYKVRTF